MKRRVLVCTASALAISVMAGAGVQGGRAECKTAWPVVASPNVGSGDNNLWGVKALSSTVAWAVGSFTPPSGGARTLTQHWDGAAWTVVPSPNVGGNGELRDIDAVSPDDVWGVGNSHVDTTSEASGRTLTEHWNGSAWAVVPSPNAGIEGGNGWLRGVLALATDDVWAVGFYFPDVEFPTLQPLIEHWDGDAWQVVPGPSKSPGTFSELYAVSGTGPSDLWAVGVRDAQVGDASTERALILHWDGEAWKRMRVPLPAARLTPFRLWDVAALTPTNAWAVGIVATNKATRTLILHWDGQAWARVRSANPSAQFQDLDGLEARSAARVWAVGTFYDAGAERMHTLIERWNGERFRKISSGNRGDSDLNDVSVVRGARLAVGASGISPQRTLVLRRCVPAQ